MSAEQGRRTLRGRKISKQMAVVDESTRQQAAQARLDALENDNDAGDALAPDSGDEEFLLQSEEEDDATLGGKKKKGAKKGGTKRKLRTAASDRHGPKSFTRLLEDASLEKMPPGMPSYLTAVAGPSVASAPRKFCSVCGNLSKYNCTRCGSKYCCWKCFATHVETRCLKAAL